MPTPREQSIRIFTEEELNGPKNVMGYPDVVSQDISQENPKSVFENLPESTTLSAILLLKLAEREGAYGLLSERTRQRLEMHFLQGMSITEIADIQNVTKQAVSQSLKLAPETLYKKMTKDVYFRKTNISFSEILLAYSDYKLFISGKKK